LLVIGYWLLVGGACYAAGGEIFQIQGSYRVYDEVAKRQAAFPDLVKID